MHIDLDGAWNRNALPFDSLDAREWGPRLRFSAPRRLIEKFYDEFDRYLAPFLLYGSGDFHHLTALWVRRNRAPIVLVSFDNHPDWDIRPPRWACGSWVNRALELPHVRKVSVWGCGNTECWWPRQIFGNRRAERAGRLEVHPWAEGRSPSARKRRGSIVRLDWQRRFLTFVKEIAGESVYVTIDLDCLRAEEAVTNWESGRFTLADLEWALCELRNATCIIAGDICGVFSPPVYARRKQRFAAKMDHPKMARPASGKIQEINATALRRLWPLLAE